MDEEILFHHLWMVLTCIEETGTCLNQVITIGFLGIKKNGKDILSYINY
jgi:hypothetical protein